MSKADYYGEPPVSLGVFDLDFTEYMHYMYLPIQIRDERNNIRYSIPENLQFAERLIALAQFEEAARGNRWDYMYVTARRGFATPGNPLNRPGWHTDGFGTEDINYVWTDRYPTWFALGDFGAISDDHVESAKQFEHLIEKWGRWDSQEPQDDKYIHLRRYEDGEFQRLDDRVVHAAPEIPAPGGERSFFKVSFSNEKYNLLGNSHNHGIPYTWEMFGRDTVRNNPAKAGADRA